MSLDFLKNVEEDIATKSEIEELKKNFQSSNPIIQIAAKAKLSQIEQLQNIRTTQRNIENSINTVKETVERTKKTTEEVIDTIQSTPSRIQNTVDQLQKDIKSTKESVDNTVEEIRAIPSNVKRAADDTRQKVTSAVETIQAIPSDVQRSIEETKKSVTDAQKKAEETITGAVQLGKSVVDTTQSVVKAGSDVAQKIGALSSGQKNKAGVDIVDILTTAEKKDTSADSSVSAKKPFFFADMEENDNPNTKDEVNDIDPLEAEINAALELAQRAIEEADDVMSSNKK